MIEYKERPWHGGVQRLYRFDNGYGASVIRTSVSYGSEQGLWELAVIQYGTAGNYNIVYETGITDDVIGYLTEEEVEHYVERISQL